MAISPMFPLWTDAYLGDTHHLSTLEHGAYLLLLITAWRSKDGTLPDDDKILSKYCRMTVDKWKKIRPVLEQFFTIQDGTWMQGRLLDERKADFDFRKSQSKKAKARHLKNKESTPAAAHAQHMPPPSPSPSPIKEEKIIQKEKQKNIPPPLDVRDGVWKDFLKLRKDKKAPVTETALKRIRAEGEKIGWSLEQTLSEMCARGWQGFNHQWILNERGKQNGKYTSDDALREALAELESDEETAGDVFRSPMLCSPE